MVCEVGRDRLADDKPLELREKSLFKQGVLPTADGVSWRTRGWKSSSVRCRARRRVGGLDSPLETRRDNRVRASAGSPRNTRSSSGLRPFLRRWYRRDPLVKSVFRDFL